MGNFVTSFAMTVIAAMTLIGCSNGLHSQNSGAEASVSNSGILTSSTNGTVIPPATKIVDSTGAVWTLTTGGQIERNGSIDGVTHEVSVLLYDNGGVYQMAEGRWWVWSGGNQPDPSSGSGWTQVSSPPVSTNVTTVPSAVSIVDSVGQVWTLTSSGQIARNGVVDQPTNGVTELEYYNGLLYQKAHGEWYYWSGGTEPDPSNSSGWTSTSAPANTTPSPTPAPAPTPAPSTSAFNHKGADIHNLVFYTSSQQATNMQSLQAIGGQWIRTAAPQWFLDNSCSGSPSFAPLDSALSNANTYGMKLLFIIEGPGASCSVNGDKVIPTDNQAWVNNFIVPMVQHYAPLGQHWYEILNEPENGWGPAGGTTATYVDLLQRAYVAIHAIDRQAVVVGGGGSDFFPNVFDNGAFSVNTMYLNGMHGYFDALSIHPYPSCGPNNWGSDVLNCIDTWNGFISPSWPTIAQIDTQEATFTGSFSGTTLTVSGVSGNIAATMIVSGSCISTDTMITAGSGSTWTVSVPQSGSCSMTASWPSLTHLMALFGDGSKSVWITEIGCNTSDSSNDNETCTQAQQAAMVTSVFGDPSNRFPQMGPVTWFELDDEGGDSCPGWEDCGLGLYTYEGGSIKPSGTAYSNVSGLW